jgi:hypothetical protein
MTGGQGLQSNQHILLILNRFFNRHDLINNLMINKQFGKLNISMVISEVEKDLSEAEAKLKALTDVILLYINFIRNIQARNFPNLRQSSHLQGVH